MLFLFVVLLLAFGLEACRESGEDSRADKVEQMTPDFSSLAGERCGRGAH